MDLDAELARDLQEGISSDIPQAHGLRCRRRVIYILRAVVPVSRVFGVLASSERYGGATHQKQQEQLLRYGCYASGLSVAVNNTMQAGLRQNNDRGLFVSPDAAR